MKVKVYVTLKPGVLDPQGKAIEHHLEPSYFEAMRTALDAQQSESGQA